MPGFSGLFFAEMFVDRAIIKVKGGNGGNGCCSFRKEKFVPKGGPDGGNGGRGGNVYLFAHEGEQSLVDYVFNHYFEAGKGENGKGKDQHGKAGKDLYLRVPPGTIVRDIQTGEIIIDINEPNQIFLVAKGGKGGKGNKCFLSNWNRAPLEHEPGEKGEEKVLDLELKTIADAGLVGYPNAGKSTLLAAVSDAHPKIAPYPFTTLHPIVGVHEFEDFSRITIADIPGLIDGAHKNIGLGHEFLRHIERTKMLVYVLDMAGSEGRNPADDFISLQKELELYMKGLSKRPALVAANKMDLPEANENLKTFSSQFPDFKIIPISALKKEHTNELLNELLKLKIKVSKEK